MGEADVKDLGSPLTAAMTAVDAAAVAELAWVVDGVPAAMPVVPLRLDGRPAVALPYATADRARGLASASSVALVLSDPRLAGRAWSPTAVRGDRPTLRDDVTGEEFAARLLDQELRKHPPSRALVDSPLLCRENWWYLPRLLITFEPTAVTPVGARTDPRTQALLALSRTGGRLDVRTVDVGDWSARPLEVQPAEGDGAAVLLAHDFTEPDVERWMAHVLTGHLSGGALRVTHGPLGPPPPLRTLGLLARVRRHRELERGCRQGISAAERAAGH
jgi:hypothetical protein